MQNPRLAWERMVELLGEGGEGVTITPPSEFSALIDPFLSNPTHHRRHIDLILEAAEISRSWQLMDRIANTSAAAMPGVGFALAPAQRWILRKTSQRRLAEFKAKVVALRDELSADVLPGEFEAYLLPTEILPTDQIPGGWTGLRVFEVETRLALEPKKGLLPERVSLHVELPRDAGAFFIGQSPESSSEFIGYRRATGRKNSQSTKDTTKIGLTKVVAVEAGEERTAATESSANEEISLQSAQPKVVASLRPVVASWELYETPGQRLIGGFAFRVRFAAPEALLSVLMSVVGRVTVTGWGPADVRLAQHVRLPSP